MLWVDSRREDGRPAGGLSGREFPPADNRKHDPDQRRDRTSDGPAFVVLLIWLPPSTPNPWSAQIRPNSTSINPSVSVTTKVLLIRDLTRDLVKSGIDAKPKPVGPGMTDFTNPLAVKNFNESVVDEFRASLGRQGHWAIHPGRPAAAHHDGRQVRPGARRFAPGLFPHRRQANRRRVLPRRFSQSELGA